MNIRDKIVVRLNDLEAKLKNGNHLGSAAEVIAVLMIIESIAKFWRVLNDEERDFINAARYALEEQKSWK